MNNLRAFLSDAREAIHWPLRTYAIDYLSIAASIFFGFEWKLLNRNFWLIGEGFNSYGACVIATVTFRYCLHDAMASAIKKLPEGENLIRIDFIVRRLSATGFAILGGRLLFTVLPPWHSGWGAILGLPATRVFEKLLGSATGRFVHNRGTKELTEAQVKKQIQSLTKDGDNQNAKEQKHAPIGADIQSIYKDGEPSFDWAGFTNLPGKVAAGNLLCVGTIGTGKTRMHRETWASVLPNIGPHSDRRALIYDVKTDALAELETMNLSCDVLVMNPYDQRSWKWDMAADIKTKADATNFANAFIEDPVGDDKAFFIDAARAVVAGVIDALNKTIPGKWTLRDIVRVSATKARLERLLAGTDLIDQYFDPPQTFDNVRNTIANVTTKLEPVAALWEHTTKKLSLKEWAATHNSVMVLAGKPGDVSRQFINRVMCKIITSTIMDGPESPERSRLWFFCDELKDAGRLNSLEDLLNGRSKGVRCVLGFQDLEGLIHSYKSAEKVKEMTSRCGSVSWLRLTSPDTAEWASKRTGETEKFEYFDVQTKDGTNVGEHLTKREAVIASEFLQLPEFDDGAISGIHILKKVSGIFKSMAHCTFPKNLDPSRNFVPRPDEEQELALWTKEDDRRLGVEEESESQASGEDYEGPDLSDLGRVEFN